MVMRMETDQLIRELQANPISNKIPIRDSFNGFPLSDCTRFMCSHSLDKESQIHYGRRRGIECGMNGNVTEL